MSRHSPSISTLNASRQASSCGESTRTPSTSKIAPWNAIKASRQGTSEEHRRAEADEAVEASERPVGHQEVDPGVDAKAAPKEMARRDHVRAGYLEAEALGAQGVRARL